MKKIILLHFFTIATFAQAQVLFQERVHVNGGSSQGLGAAQTKDGGYVFGSLYTDSNINGTVICKLDSSGLEAWIKIYDLSIHTLKFFVTDDGYAIGGSRYVG